MEILQFKQLQSVSSLSPGNNNAYTCMVDRTPEFECLDLAGASTLSSIINTSFFNETHVDTKENDPASNSGHHVDSSRLTLGTAIDSYTSRILYGTSSSCNGKIVGDGVINGMDAYVLASSIFQLGPYRNIGDDLSQVFTVQGRDDTAARCNSDILNRLEWQKRIFYSNCYTVHDEDAYSASLGRRLFGITSERFHEETGELYVDTNNDLNARIYHWANGDIYGNWFLIKLQKISVSLELFVYGLESAGKTPISNERAPGYNSTSVPWDPDHFHLRYIHHWELTGGPPVECPILKSYNDPMAALQAGQISISQRLSSSTTQTHLCGFDLVVWKPAWSSHENNQCELKVASGSVSMDGNGGAIQRHSSCVQRVTPTQSISNISSVRVTMLVAGDVSDFNKTSFKIHMAHALDVPVTQVLVDVYAASVNVVVRIFSATNSIAELFLIQTKVINKFENVSEASRLLNVTVEEVGDATLENVDFSPPSQPPSESESSNVYTLLFSLLTLAVVLLGLTACCISRHALARLKPSETGGDMRPKEKLPLLVSLK